MARRKRDGRLIMVRVTEEAYNAVVDHCNFSQRDLTTVAGGVISRHYREMSALMPAAATPDEAEARARTADRNKWEKDDEDMYYAQKLYDALNEGADLTKKGWDWLDAYHERKGMPPRERLVH